MDAASWIDLAQRYFEQRRELFGPEIWTDFSPPSMVGAEAEEATTLAEFYEQIRHCQKCRLGASRTNFVFGVGNPQARLMCIGEAPGRDEDLQGEPFVGAAGKLLDKILAAIGFERDEVYIANIVKCRPPGNRDPESDEIEMCRPYVLRQIELIQPSVILTLGRVAAQALLQTTKAVARLRGIVHPLGGAVVVVTYHPAALLRDVRLKRLAWEDVQLARRVYDERVGDKPPLQPGKKSS